MKLKLNEQGFAHVQDGKPVYVHDDGKEVPFDAPTTVAKFDKLSADLDKQRTQAHEAEDRLKAFDGFDLEAARKALQTVKDLSDKKLIEAGEVEKYRADIERQANEKLLEEQGKTKAAEERATSLLKGVRFSNSKFVSDKLLLPAPIAQQVFGDHFKVEGEDVVGYINGNRILSRERIGEPADFDEALAAIVEKYPMKDRILKSAGPGGSAATASQRNGNDAKTIPRSEFDAMPAAKQSEAMKAGMTVVD